jgi:hypothetical protein
MEALHAWKWGEFLFLVIFILLLNWSYSPFPMASGISWHTHAHIYGTPDSCG